MHRPTCLLRLPFLPTCLLFDPIEYTVLIRWTESPRGWGGICWLALAPPASIYNLCIFWGYFGGPRFENMDLICGTSHNTVFINGRFYKGTRVWFRYSSSYKPDTHFRSVHGQTRIPKTSIIKKQHVFEQTRTVDMKHHSSFPHSTTHAIWTRIDKQALVWSS